MKIQMCRVKGDFEVVRFHGTEESAHEVAKHCSGVAHLTSQGDWQVMIDEKDLAEKDDYIVNDKEGGWAVFEPEAFEKHFEII